MDWWQYQITQGFGPTSEQLDGGYAGYAHFNKGIDFAAPMGTPVRSVVSGTVVSAGDSGDGWGTSVKIRDAYGNTHNLGHLSTAQVQPGQTILAGQLVGASGSTGKSTGPHVSYDVWDPAGNFFDPYQFIAQAPGASPPMQVDPEDSFLAEPDGTPGVGTTAAPPASPDGLPPGAVDTGAGYAYAVNPATGGIVYYTQDAYTGEWRASPTAGLGQPYTGPPSIRHDPATGQAFEWKNGTWVPSPMWDDPSRAQGAGVLRNVFNPQTGQTHLAVVDPKTGTVINWGDAVSAPKEPGYATIPSAATPNAPAAGMLDAGTQRKAPNQWDALSLANAITQGGAGQQFTQHLGGGNITAPQAQLVGAVANNQYNNNDFILRTYGIDTSKADWQDPVKVAAAAQTLGARQKGLVDAGYDPTMAQSIIMMENQSQLSNPLSQQMMSSPNSGGQQVIVGPDGHTYSAAAYKQAFG